MFTNGFGPWHVLIIVLLVVLLFGARRLPDAARSIGKSMKIFKAETRDLRDNHDEAPVEPEKKELTPGTKAEPAASAADQQVAELQRQLDELKKQQQEQPQKHAS